MSHTPSTPRERIIPIRIERDEPDVSPSSSRSEPVASPSAASLPENSSEISENHRSLPFYNCQEKIIIVVDGAEDEHHTPFQLQNSSNTSRDMIKRAISMFIRSKSMINNIHEYALVVLTENNAVWTLDFTNDLKAILNALDKVGMHEAEDIFELSSIFDVISSHVRVPRICEVEGLIVPPVYVVRTILFYNRSYTLPVLTSNDKIESLLKAEYFTLDVAMSHEPMDEGNNSDKIFKVLQKLDTKGYGYFFSVERDAKTLFESVAKLLGHPLQRHIQKNADYRPTVVTKN